jgi:hypothetical protein
VSRKLKRLFDARRGWRFLAGGPADGTKEFIKRRAGSP